MLFSKLFLLNRSSSRQRSARRKSSMDGSCVHQCDHLEPRVLLTADHEAPVITHVDSDYGVVLVELQDMWAPDVTIWIDVEADGTFEGSLAHEGIGLPSIISVPGDIPPNSEVQVAIKAVRAFVGGEDGTDYYELTSNIVTLTAKGHELLPIVPLSLDVDVETVWGELDREDIVGTVDIVYQEGTQWISIGDVTQSWGQFTLSTPESTIGHEITLTTRHSWMGVDVYGPIYTFFNEPIGDFWAEDPGTGSTEPPLPGGSEGDEEEAVAEEPPTVATDGSADAQLAASDADDGSVQAAIDQFMAGLGTDDDWFYAVEEETEEDDAAFFES